MDQSERVLVKYPLFKTAVARIQACFDSVLRLNRIAVPSSVRAAAEKPPSFPISRVSIRESITSGVSRSRFWWRKSRPGQQ